MSGLFSTKNDKPLTVDINNTFFNGQLSTSGDIRLDPLISGYSFIIWTKLPTWLTAQYPNFRELTEKNLKSFQGNEDLELENADLTQGFSKTATSYVGSMAQVPDGFTMSHNEFSGSPIAKAYGFWVGSIRDPKTNIALYPTYGDGKTEYSSANHSAELLYIKTRPDANNKTNGNIIEYASYYTNVVPKKIPLAHQNFEAGTNEAAAALEIPFFGRKHFGESINTYAKTQLAKTYDFLLMNDFTTPTFSQV